MKRLLLALLLCGLTVVASAIDSESFDDPALQARYQHLTHSLRCPKCQNEAIAESPVGVSSDLRREVRRMLLAGSTDQEILDFMSARYGDFILYKPPFTTRTLVLWLAPAVVLLGALVTVVVVIRRRATHSFDDALDADNESRAHTEADAS